MPENKMYWHSYKGCMDAPKVSDHPAKSFLCKVQRFHKDTREAIGFVSYQVCLCDDNGMFYGMRGSVGPCVAEVISWTDIVES